MPPSPRSRWSPAGSSFPEVRKLLLAVVVLVALLAVTDRVAESFAERAVADRIDAELDQRPKVEIHGFSFLLQAVQGHYDEITVSGTRASKDGIGVSDFRAELDGVDIPLGDALHGSVDKVPTQVIKGSALVRYADVAAVAGNGITVAADGKQRVRVTGTVNVLGQRLEASAVSEVRITGKRLTIRAVSYQVDGASPPAAVQRAIGSLLDVTVTLPDLPYKLTIEDVAITKTGIRLVASARGVVLTR